ESSAMSKMMNEIATTTTTKRLPNKTVIMWASGVAAGLAVLFVAIIIAYNLNLDWTGFNQSSVFWTANFSTSATQTFNTTSANIEQKLPAKALWDWIQIFGIAGIPIVVGAVATYFAYRQARSGDAANRTRENESKAQRDKEIFIGALNYLSGGTQS